VSILLMTAAFKTRLPAVRKLVLVALCDSANDQGECYPSVASLVEKCSLSARGIQVALTDLEALGYLRRAYREGRSTVYHVAPVDNWPTPAPDAPPHDVHPAPGAPQPRTPCTPPPHGVHPTPARRAPITVKEPKENPKGNHKAPMALTVDDLVAEGIPRNVATEFLELRKRKRAPLTPLAWEGIKREAGLAGWLASAALVKCLERGWQGFDATWVESRKDAALSKQAKAEQEGKSAADEWLKGEGF